MNDNNLFGDIGYDFARKSPVPVKMLPTTVIPEIPTPPISDLNLPADGSVRSGKFLRTVAVVFFLGGLAYLGYKIVEDYQKKQELNR